MREARARPCARRCPGVRLVLAAMGPKMCALAGAEFDGVFFNWMTPEFAASAREHVEAGRRARRGASRHPSWATSAPRSAPDAAERLAKEEGFYRDLHDGYRNHFDRLGEPEGTVGRRRRRPRRGAGASSPRYDGARRHRRPRPRLGQRRGDERRRRGRRAVARAVVGRQVSAYQSPSARNATRTRAWSPRSRATRRCRGHEQRVDGRRQLHCILAGRSPSGAARAAAPISFSVRPAPRSPMSTMIRGCDDRDLLDHAVDALGAGQRRDPTPGT